MERKMNENMSVAEQLSKIDQYIDWVKKDDNDRILQEKAFFMYRSEYIQSLETKKWLITEGHGLSKLDKKLLNTIENLMKK